MEICSAAAEKFLRRGASFDVKMEGHGDKNMADYRVIRVC